jgi:peptidyl-prolyl cis-trans isomerase A (cyclophilin A)
MCRIHRSLLPLLAALALIQASCMADTPAPPNLRAPEAFTVLLDTSRGPVTVEVTRSSAPVGVDRLYSMVKSGYLDGARFFRVVPGFVIQFGLSGNPALSKVWNSPIKDDPPKRGNKNLRGTVVFAATEDPNSRTTQLFFNLADNTMLDRQGFVPVGRVSKGMEVVERFFSGYGEDPDQGLILSQGDAYLSKAFPSLDYIKTATIVPAALTPGH